MNNVSSIDIYVYEASGRRTYTLEKTTGLLSHPIYFLDKLEEIVKNNLPYTPYSNYLTDFKPQITEEEAPAVLQEIAKLAYKDFENNLASDKRYRFKEWPHVRRFLNLFYPSLPLPQELIKKIGQNLKFSTLINYSQVNVNACRESQAVFEELAISNGYTFCKQFFPFSISHINYLKVLTCFKQNVYGTKNDPFHFIMFQGQKEGALRYVYRLDSAITFQSSLDLCGNDSLFEKIVDKICTLNERAIFCSLAHTRSTSLIPCEAVLLNHFEKNIKKALIAEKV